MQVAAHVLTGIAFDIDQILALHHTYINLMKFMSTLKPIFTTQAKRNTVFMMLLLWLFALTSGVVNACILEGGRAQNHHGALRHAHATTVATEGSDEHAGSTDDHHAGELSSKASCLKVCDDSSQALAKLSSGIVEPAELGFAPLLVTVAWTTTALVASGLDRMDDFRPPRSRGPISIRLLRLAL